MTKLINLRQFRKQKTRTEKAIHAEENRFRYGQTKVQKLFNKKESLKAQRFLEQNCLVKMDENENDSR
ncbi:DUF4169 family protein [Bartonella ancashensis]|uniref:Uncharacterized protein n=1 Tax=Bartonella ancashensis TaxID=1318743 RepID=A0A0M4M3M0_9HYPH|nr:DUF4169 family protein [Bartonella ancashensis]ALE03637.1 hypothetical protein PU02_0823 [Bartonella ancashensis]